MELIGQKIDKYEIIEQLGEGGMAVVYRAKHLNLPRDVAIKILHPHLSSKERNRNRFSKEAQAIELLDHPNILKILDYSGQDVNCSYIIMELIRGPNLKEILVERKRIPSEVVALIGIHLCRALQYAHEKNLVHRDLKPENVMLSREGILKLTDFGIARFLDDAHVTITGALVGSPAYMSPEQAKDLVVDSRSDLFSLGILLYHLVCGQLPFSGSNPSIILRNIIENNFVPPNEIAMDISMAMTNVIHALLKVEPEERPQQSVQIIPLLEECLTEAGIAIDDERWSLKMWISDPDSYEERLFKKLEEHLVIKAKMLIKEEKHLEAQPVLNRILSINPESEETMELIQQFHSSQIQVPPKKENSWLRFTIPLLFASFLGVILWPSMERESIKDIQNTTASITNVKPSEPVISSNNKNQIPEQEGIDNLDKTQGLDDSIILEKVNSESTVPVMEVQENKNSSSMEITNLGMQDEDEKKHKNEKFPNMTDEKKILSNELLIEMQKNKRQVLQPNIVKKQRKKVTITNGSQEVPSNPMPEEFALVTVTVPSSWADIYIDGEKKGRTGQVREIKLFPGSHELRLENDFAIPYVQKFTISAGESRIIEVQSLQKKPSILVIPATFSSDCTIQLQNSQMGIEKKDLGTLKSLNYQVKLSEPTYENIIELQCAGESLQKTIKPHQPGSTIPLPL